MTENSTTPSRFRFIRAYRVTLKILITYLFLLSLRKIMGTNLTKPLIQRTHQKTAKKILTAGYIDGIKVTNIEALKKYQINPQEVAISLIHAYCKQIFIDGVYHADPHPGNIIIIPHEIPSPQNFKIALVDYGATAIISPEMKAGITQFVEGLIIKAGCQSLTYDIQISPHVICQAPTLFNS